MELNYCLSGGRIWFTMVIIYFLKIIYMQNKCNKTVKLYKSHNRDLSHLYQALTASTGRIPPRRILSKRW